jgi:putative toxin-antitoxin system antitoxin component (TIGR02293 family)
MRTFVGNLKAMPEKFVFEEPAITYNLLEDKNAYSLIYAIKKGIKYTFFEQLSKISPFTTRDWSGFLHLSERSMQRYKKEEGTFGPVSSEKIIEITMLYKYGIEVFGDKEKFNTWLNLTNVALGNIKPKELLDTSFGIGLLKDELNSIEHGVLA